MTVTQRVYNLLTAILFLAIMLMHAWRLYGGWPVTIGNVSIPMWASVIGILIASYISYNGFRLGWRK